MMLESSWYIRQQQHPSYKPQGGQSFEKSPHQHRQKNKEPASDRPKNPLMDFLVLTRPKLNLIQNDNFDEVKAISIDSF